MIDRLCFEDKHLRDIDSKFNLIDIFEDGMYCTMKYKRNKSLVTLIACSASHHCRDDLV